jgi:outer membrane protein OmpA-like peptidoglycan-associated protein
MLNRALTGIAILLFSFPSLAQEIIEKLSPEIYTIGLDETSPVVSRDGSKLFFTRTADPDFESTMPDGNGQWKSGIKDDAYKKELSLIYSQISGQTVTNPVASALNQDIWYAPIVEDTIRSPLHPGYPINNALPNSLVSTGILPNEYVLINQFYKDGSMYAGFSRVRMDEHEQTFPEPMYIYGFNIIGSNVNLTMTPNGHTIILSIQGPGSEGENDLYASFYVRDNVWSTPIHMGKVINSPYQETTPFITPDKRYLYFSSNRPGGVGGNDIYRSERLDYTWMKWTAPVLVSGGVNSTADDSQPYFDPEARYMYFTSRRDGSSDIFRLQLFDKQRLKKPIVVLGRIINTKTGKLTRSEIFWGQLSAKDYLEYFNSYNGEFVVTLTEYEPYKFQLRKPNHLASRILVDPRLIEKQGKDTVEIFFYLEPKDHATPDSLATSDFVLKQLYPDSVFLSDEEVKNPSSGKENRTGGADVSTSPSSFYDIYFLKAKAVILSKSENALDQIFVELINNPSLEILIIGHTDNVGDGIALIELSNERARAVKNYLVNKGINPNRIQTSGMGAENPLYENTTESGREKNRRVEIKILVK